MPGYTLSSIEIEVITRLIVAAVLGVFLAFARRQTGGIQTGMVAHALIVTVWKTFLK